MYFHVETLDEKTYLVANEKLKVFDTNMEILDEDWFGPFKIEDIPTIDSQVTTVMSG